MNIKLAFFCARLWILGLMGMGIAKVLFGVGPGEMAFDLAARVWAVGGLGFLLVGALHLSATPEAQ